MLSNAYFLANFRFDIAENEPAKNLQNLRTRICEQEFVTRFAGDLREDDAHPNGE